MRIVRFLTFADAKRVLSDCSTFALNSSLYYRKLGWESDDRIGDRNENYVQFQDNRRTYELGAATLLSCWTKLHTDELPSGDWDIFPDRKDGIAIVSNIASVRCLMRDLVRKVLGLADEDNAGWHFREGHVTYYDGSLHPPEFDTMDAWQWKLDRYASQREYRFALLAGSPRNHLQTVIFEVDDPRRYVDKIYFGPQQSEQQKRMLAAGAIEANLIDRVQHFEKLYNRS